MTAELGKNRREELKNGASYEVGDLIPTFSPDGNSVFYSVIRVKNGMVVAENLMRKSDLIKVPFSFFDRFARGSSAELVTVLRDVYRDLADIVIPVELEFGDRYNVLTKHLKREIAEFFHASHPSVDKLYNVLLSVRLFEHIVLERKVGISPESVRKDLRDRMRKVNDMEKLLGEEDPDLKLVTSIRSVDKAIKLLSAFEKESQININ